MAWITGTLVVVLASVLAWRWAAKPIVYRGRSAAELRPFLDSLTQMAEGSVLLVEHEGSDRFFQFAQASDVPGVDQLVFGFPDAPWSRDYFDDVVDACRAQGFDHAIREVGAGATTRFLEVPVAGSRERVLDLASAVIDVARSAIGLGTDETFSVRLMGNPDHVRWATANRSRLETMREKGGVYARFAHWNLHKIPDAVGRERADPPDGA